MTVAVIGASDKPDRYSYQALNLLREKGHTVYPVHTRIKTIDGVAVYPSISDIQKPIHTITLYVSADISSSMQEAILSINPKRIIFNPGAENPSLMQATQEKGIVAINACTLVMLRTNQFDHA